MNRDERNHKKTDVQNVHGLKKVSFWEKYGAKRFPYRGRRRYSPFVYRSEDGGIVISNDVFGLTIRQFERTYNACLDRRKAHEQYILNIRYPDKTSDKYMEYLENSRCNNTVNCNGYELKNIYLSEHLMNTAGSEIDMRTRQQLFIIKDLICSKNDIEYTPISSGSLAEGIDLPGSDIDVMFVIEDVEVIRDIRNTKHQVQRTTLLMETDVDHPGFTRLLLIAEREWGNNDITYQLCESTRQGLYLSINKFSSFFNKTRDWQLSPHGPCVTDQDETIDLVNCLRSKYLPFNTIQWASRHRQQWPSNSTIDKITQYGCLLVPIGPRNVPNCNVLWRLSFSVAEKQLVHSFNFTQLLCYCLLKLTLKHIVNTNRHAKGLLCSYFLKTVLFWVSEEVDIDTFQISKLFVCFSHCLDKLKLWVQNCYCPNYFIPEHNMFLGKVNSENNTILLNVLDAITCDGIDGLTNKIFPNDNESCHLLRTKREYSFIRLDFLFYRTSCLYNISNTSRCLKILMFIESLIESSHSTFIKDVCKVHYASISQYAAQLLPTPTTTIETYNIHKRYHRHFQDGIKADAVSGWLLYASFYYVRGQCSPDMLVKGCSNYSDRNSHNYRINVHHSMTLSEKILGVCYEISGDKDSAYQCYDEALQCDGLICPSAQARKSKLLEI